MRRKIGIFPGVLRHTPRSSNGRTRDSESLNRGSNPRLGTKKKQPLNGCFFLVPPTTVGQTFDVFRTKVWGRGSRRAPQVTYTFTCTRREPPSTSRNHHDLFLQTGTGCDQENPHSSSSAGFRLVRLFGDPYFIRYNTRVL